MAVFSDRFAAGGIGLTHGSFGMERPGNGWRNGIVALL